MPTPNTALQAARLALRLSQDELARRLQASGAESASKRQVQRLESGDTVSPRPALARALEAVFGLPMSALGFTGPRHESPGEMPTGGARGHYSGVWLSRYEYPSSSRGSAFVDERYVLLMQHGDQLSVRSLPSESTGELVMTLTVDGQVVTGTWTEVTAADGYYRGARYHGAIQMLAEPSGHRLAGKWLGFNRDMGIATGPWDLTLEDSSTGPKTIEAYSRVP